MPSTDAPTVTSGSPARPRVEPTAAGVGPSIPGYQLISLLGRGGMGEVWRARRADGEVVALKLLLPADDDADAFERVSRFERETAAMSMLAHPGIVRIVDRGQVGPTLFYAMELVEGVNLRRAQRNQPLTPAGAVRLIVTLCEAVSHAHRMGVVHRDLKPENVLMDGSGRPRLVDFGIAAVARLAAPLTQTGVAMGTPGYMAPEQQRDARRVDGRADIYSLGVMLYELLCGERPGVPCVPASRRVKDLHPRFDAVINRCLASKPSGRYLRAEDLRCELLSLLRQLGETACEPTRAGAEPPVVLSRDKDVMTVRIDSALDPIQFDQAVAKLGQALDQPGTVGLGYHLCCPTALGEMYSDVLSNLHRTHAKGLHRVGFASEVPFGRARAGLLAAEVNGAEAAVFASPAAMAQWLSSGRLAASARRIFAFTARAERRHGSHVPKVLRDAIRERGLLGGLWWFATALVRWLRARRALGEREYNVVAALVSSFNGAAHCAHQGLAAAMAQHLEQARRPFPRHEHELVPLIAKSDAELLAAYEQALSEAGLDPALPRRVYALKFAEDVPRSVRDRHLMALIEVGDRVSLACVAEEWALEPFAGEIGRRLQQAKNEALARTALAKPAPKA